MSLMVIKNPGRVGAPGRVILEKGRLNVEILDL